MDTDSEAAEGNCECVFCECHALPNLMSEFKLGKHEPAITPKRLNDFKFNKYKYYQ